MCAAKSVSKVDKAAVAEASKALSNWGRWGKDDHVGTLNHVTPQDIVDAAGLIRSGKVFAVDGMVEKPPKGTAPSNLSITGRYILQPEIFKILKTQEKGAGGEIQLTDGMKKLSESQKFYGLEFEGERHDCGSRAGFLRANIAYGMARPDLRDGLRAELKKYLGK